MKQGDAVLRILLIDDLLENAERLTSILRNGGMAVRPQRAESPEELAQLIDAHPFDLVLAALDGRQIAFEQVTAIVTASGKDLEVLAVIDQLDAPTAMRALNAGARDMVLRSEPRHVQFIVRSEADAVHSRRAFRHSESLLRETERRCDALIDSSRDPIAYIHEGMHIRANEAYLEMFGYANFEEVQGLSVLDLLADDSANMFKQLLKRISKGEHPPKHMDLRAVSASGEQFNVSMEFSSASYEGEACLQIVIRPQVIDPDVARELEDLRLRDAVTRLLNRAAFMAELDSVVANAAEGRGHQALLVLEPDNYEVLVASIGLAQADALLKAFCARMTQALGQDVIAGRIGDHRFGVLCTAHDHNASGQQANALLDAFRGHIIEAGDRSASLTISIGGVQIGQRNATLAQVLDKAEESLRAALVVGGNRVEIHDPAAGDRAEHELVDAWLRRLRQAIAEDQFLLHYQPIISLNGEPAENYEVYVRMRGSAGEVILPGDFLPLARQNGLGVAIDRWVIERAVADIAERLAKGRDTTLFVKVFPDSISSNEKLGDEIVHLVRANGIPGQRLVLQLHEPLVFTHLKAIQNFQKVVGAAGVRLALEHFGTGLNSFQTLEQIRADVAKIDRSFIQDLAKNPANQTKVREFAQKAREMGKTCIAHYVQDAGSMTVLFSSGVDYVEGDFLAPASPIMNYDFG